MEAHRRRRKRARTEEDQKPKIAMTTTVQSSKSEPQQYIPHEVMHDILLRLPAKSLLRFKRVCKSWRALISDPRFIKSQNNLATNKGDIVTYCQISKDGDHHPEPVSLTFIDPQVSETETVRLPSPFKYHGDSVKVLGSCNGLLLIGTSSETLLWNPITGESKTLAKNCSERYCGEDYISGLGYDSYLDEYKAVLFVDEGTSHTMFLSSTSRTGNNGSWKEVDEVHDFPYCIYGSSCLGITVNGAPHWAVSKKSHSSLYQTIIYFDNVEGKFKRLPTPTASWLNEKYRANLSVLTGCLSATLYDAAKGDFHVWTMKEYGVNESWTKLFVIRMLCTWSLMPLGFTKNCNEVVLHIDKSHIVAYNLSTKEVKFVILTTNKSGVVCVESFVSPECNGEKDKEAAHIETKRRTIK